MNCKICGGKTKVKFEAMVLNKYEGKYLICDKCGYLFAGDPYWLEEAYKSAINISDTGIMSRNIHFSRMVSVLIYFFFDKNGMFVDYAGGYGIFTRLMRDIGLDFYWQDPYCENLLARGFEYDSLSKENINLITAFEVFEHLSNPLDEIDKMLKISNNIVFSTVLLPPQIPEPGEWWYYGLDHGQHVSFYSPRTLRAIADKFGLNFYSYKEIHLFTKKKLNYYLLKRIISLSPRVLYHFVKLRLTSKMWDDHLIFEGKKIKR